MSPELMEEKSYNESADVWSVGCIIYELCALSPPFTAKNLIQLAKRIHKGRVERIPSEYSDNLMEVIRHMLNTDPEKRPNIL